MTAEQQLTRFYQQAAKRLQLRIQLALESGRLGSVPYLEAQLSLVRGELNQLAGRGRALATQTAYSPYRAGALVADLGAAPGPAFSFTSSHRRAADVLARNLTTQLDQAVQLVGRRSEDVLRKVALEEIGIGQAAGESRREVSAAIERRLVKENVTDAVTGFVDKAGKRWQLDVYARMAARTTTREAVSAGLATRMRETGQQLVTISDHGTETEICKPYEGETFAMPGETVEGYETLDTMPPFHPNCIHVATPGLATLDESLALLERELGVETEG